MDVYSTYRTIKYMTAFLFGYMAGRTDSLLWYIVLMTIGNIVWYMIEGALDK